MTDISQYFPTRGATTPMWSFGTEAAAKVDFRQLAQSGANSVIIDFQLRVSSLSGSRVSWGDSTVTDGDLKEAITLAGEAGLKVWLKPIVQIGNQGLNWQQLDPTSKQTFFSEYDTKILQALKQDAHGYVSNILLSNELTDLTTNPGNIGYWQTLIDKIHAARPDLLVGFNAMGLMGDPPGQSEFERIPDALYSLVNFVGISAYPVINAKTVQGFENGWHHDQFGIDQVQVMLNFFSRNSLPIFFTELGSRYQHGGQQFPQGASADAAFFDASFKVISQELSSRVAGVFPYAWMLNDNDFTNVPWQQWGLNEKPEVRGILADWFSGHENQFIFDSVPGSQIEGITGFRRGLDKIVLFHADFRGIGPIGHLLAAADFHIGVHATTHSQHIIYNPHTGFLFYDPDGSGHMPQIHFATVNAHLAPSNMDFLVLP